MELYYTATSPFVRKVLIAAHELGLFHRLTLRNLRPSPLSPDPELSVLNPLSKIPALVLQDGTALFDSRVIIEYLETQAEGRRITPTDGPARFEALRLQALCDGILDAGILVFYEQLQRPQELQWQPWLAGQRMKVIQGLDALEVAAKGFGATFEVGQIAAAAALGWLDFRNLVGDFRDGRPTLASWLSEASQRDSVKATMPLA